MKCTWTGGGNQSAATLFDVLRKTANAGSGSPRAMSTPRARRRRRGSRRPTRSLTSRTAPLEPRAAVAEWSGDKLTVWTGTQRPFGVQRRAGRRVSHPEGPRARDRAGHRIGLRRQAHRRRRGRGRAAREGGGQAREARLDARGGVDLGVLPPGRRDRRPQRRQRRRHGSRPGSSTTTTRAARASARPTTSRTSASSSTTRPRRFDRARIAAWPRRPITSRASRTWTNWRPRSAWIRSSSA